MIQRSVTHLPDDAPGAQALGRFVAARLNEAVASIDRDSAERLRAARERALASRKRVVASARPTRLAAPQPALAGAGSAHGASGAGLGPEWGSEDPGLWTRLASLVPLVALLAGLAFINGVQNQYRAAELADVDAQLLTDDLPPAAFTDPGFIEFLRSSAEQATAPGTPDESAAEGERPAPAKD